jgi:hypothetical protein
MRLSQNFTLDEFVRSSTAKKLGIDNTPAEEKIENLKILCSRLLEPLRKNIGCPIIILSGYRCPKLNKAVGGAENSQHQEGKAVDIKVLHLNNLKLYQKIQTDHEFDQLILENCYDPYFYSGWVHVSWNGVKNRNKSFIFDCL